MPKELVHLYIFDPKSKEPLQNQGNIISESSETNKGYMKKHQGFIFNISQPGEELNKFIENFLDEKLDHHYVSDERIQKSKVKYINSQNFENEILKNTDFENCVIEIYKDHCPACFISKFNTNVISRKFHKHGVLDKLPLFRMKITNQVPWLGDLPHTPLHLFIRK